MQLEGLSQLKIPMTHATFRLSAVSQQPAPLRASLNLMYCTENCKPSGRLLSDNKNIPKCFVYRLVFSSDSEEILIEILFVLK
jgi:hypothetical protein